MRTRLLRRPPGPAPSRSALDACQCQARAWVAVSRLGLAQRADLLRVSLEHTQALVLATLGPVGFVGLVAFHSEAFSQPWQLTLTKH